MRTMLWVENPVLITVTILLEAAPFAPNPCRSLPFNVTSQDAPPYPSWEGRPDGAGRVLPKYAG